MHHSLSCKQAHKQQVDVPQQSVQADDGHMFTAEDGQLGEMCSKMMKCVLHIKVILRSTFAVVTCHPQETHGDPSRKLLSSGDSPLPQDANKGPKQKQQQPLGQHSTGM